MSFYVYQHWRPDKGVCFWVGKGHGYRAWRMRGRNNYHRHIVQKLRRSAIIIDVRIIRDGLTEQQALAVEIERISLWRGQGIALANLTDGGEGVAGLKHSEATRAIIKEKRKKQEIRHSDETKRKIGAANAKALKGRKNPEHGLKMRGRKLSSEHTAKIVAKLIGRTMSAQTKEKIRQSNLGQKRSLKSREKMRVAHLGKKQSLEQIQKRAEALKKYWSKPENHERRSAIMREVLASPQIRENMRRAQIERHQRA